MSTHTIKSTVSGKVLNWMFGKSAPRKNKKRQKSNRLGFETLDGRIMLTAVVSAPLAHTPAAIEKSVTAPAVATKAAAAPAVLTLSDAMNATTTTVSYNIANFDTFLTWPTSPGFYIQVGSEVMKVTSFGNVNDFTVERASNDVDTTHNVGDAIQLTTAPNLLPPATPTNFKATAVSTSQINLSWSAVSGATGYVVYEWVNGQEKQIDTTSATSFPVTQLQAGTAYYFEVAAYGNGGTGTSTNWASATTLAQAPVATVPATPTNLLATAVSSSQINISWSAVSGATGYQVTQYNSATGQEGYYYATSNWFVGAALSASTTYYYEVAAINAVGTGSAAGWAYATTFAAKQTAPVAPANFTAKATSASTVNLAWTDSAGATSFVVQKLVSGAWTTINTLGSTAVSYTVPSLTPGTTFQFRVGAENAAGTNWSTQSALTYPAALTTVNYTKVSTTSLKLSWNPVQGATGYYIEVYHNGVCVGGASDSWSTTGLNYTVNGLSTGTTYTYEIGAYDASGASFGTFNIAN